MNKNVIKRIMACGLALSMVITGGNLTAGSASAAKKKALKINKKKITIQAGKTAQLSVSNAKKTVKWSTSNKKVVKITQKNGSKITIKGLKKGKATITAKSGGKKVTCKVTVKKAKPNFKSVSVDRFDNALVLNLKKKDKSLAAGDLKVYVKSFKQSAMNHEATVEYITTANAKQYRVYLNETIHNGDYVQITSGVSKASAQFKQTMHAKADQINLTTKLNVKYGASSLENYFENEIGTLSYKVTKGNLPQGLTLDAKMGKIKGIATAAGASQCTVKATDELGRSASVIVNFGVYSKDALFCGNDNAEVALNDNVEVNGPGIDAANENRAPKDRVYLITNTFKPVGGSGKYLFTLEANDTPGACLSTDKTDAATQAVVQEVSDSTTLQIPYSVKAGKHTFTVTIKDAMDANKTATATFTLDAKNYFNVTGTLKGTNGTAANYTRTYFVPSTYRDSKDTIYDLYTDSEGGYSVELPKGKYDVYVWNGLTYRATSSITVKAADVQKIVKIPVKLYTITANATYSNKDNVLADETIYFEVANAKYEGARAYTVTTDSHGAFSLNVAANTYSAYIFDEKGNRKYFDQNIKIVNKDVTLNSMKASIARYKVEGQVLNGTASDASNVLDAVANKTISFINDKGYCMQTTTDSRGAYTIYLEGGKSYKVTAEFGDAVRNLGTVTVADANLSKQILTYTKETEFASAVDGAIGTEIKAVSTGNNDLIYKFVSAQDDILSVEAFSDAYDSYNLYVLDENGQVVATYNSLFQASANKPYYVKIVPYGKKTSGMSNAPQGIGEATLLVRSMTTAAAVNDTQGADITFTPHFTTWIKVDKEDYSSKGIVLSNITGSASRICAVRSQFEEGYVNTGIATAYVQDNPVSLNIIGYNKGTLYVGITAGIQVYNDDDEDGVFSQVAGSAHVELKAMSFDEDEE